jgi:hypothetical protein
MRLCCCGCLQIRSATTVAVSYLGAVEYNIVAIRCTSFNKAGKQSFTFDAYFVKCVILARINFSLLVVTKK